MSNPKVAYLTSCYPAPSHVFIRREILELRNQGLEVHTFSVRPPTPEQRVSEEDRAAYESTFYLMPAKPGVYLKANFWGLTQNPVGYLKTFGLALRHRAPGLKNLVWAFFHFLEAMVLAKELQRREITHVHNHFANASANVSLLATRFLSLAYSLTLHAHSETDYPAGVTLAAKLREADFAVCISNFMRAQASRILPSNQWGKLHIARCAIDLKRLPQRQPRHDNTFRFISVARLAEEKGHAGLLEAFARVRLSTSTPTELVLVGGGPERSNIEAKILELGLTGHVHMRGALPETQTLQEIANADCMVLASFMEGLPVVLMEAMALRIPVIAPNLAGIPDMVKHDHNGLLFLPADWKDLRIQMLRILMYADMRHDFGLRGRATIEAHFDISKAVKPVHDLFMSTHQARTEAQENTQRILVDTTGVRHI